MNATTTIKLEKHITAENVEQIKSSGITVKQIGTGSLYALCKCSTDEHYVFSLNGGHGK